MILGAPIHPEQNRAVFETAGPPYTQQLLARTQKGDPGSAATAVSQNGCGTVISQSVHDGYNFDIILIRIISYNIIQYHIIRNNLIIIYC